MGRSVNYNRVNTMYACFSDGLHVEFREGGGARGVT